MILTKKLKNYLFIKEIKEVPENCEIGILFGGYEMIPNRANSAIKLYKDGKIKTIVISGGIGYLDIHRKEREANELYQYLVKNGVEESNIIIEDQSKNTYQNLKNSYSIIKNKYSKDTNVVLITSDFHLKRCFIIAKNFFDSYHIYGYSIKSSKYKNIILLVEVILLNYYRSKLKSKKC